jgi:N utilization substance protein B
VNTPGRRSARRQAVFVLYQQDLLDITPQAALTRDSEGKIPAYSRALVLGVAAHRSDIDALLSPHLAGWSLDRLGALERSILRLGVYELSGEEAVPSAVVIDEAVTLAKRFCSDEAGALINGVLGSVACQMEADDDRPRVNGET